MAGKKRKIVKTLYVENMGNPLRLELTQDLLDRVKKLQEIVESLHLRRNEAAVVEITLRKAIIRIRKAYLDIGTYGYEGWESYIVCLPSLKNLDHLPKVYFSSMFLYYSKGELRPGRKDAYDKIILPRHKELIVWRKIAGGF